MWDPKYVRLTPTAKEIYDELFRTKILHYTPESAAQHVTQVWKILIRGGSRQTR
ncbi:hypothetical protein EMGBS4_01560 [Acidimicrobiaceae bacterium]|nr:hypothetical protein EMGBS4_01560 [Acidimicrobiaceae bacterium]